ncbi:MAG: AAA family ATPase, partial [Gammaproteobacteria bacterium]
MGRSKTAFVCRSCGAESPRWQGQCAQCGEWNTMEDAGSGASRPAGRGSRAPAARAVALLEAGADPGTGPDADPSSASAAPAGRTPSGSAELDRVLGGGIVAGSVTLLGGDPGIGKSTLLLQVAAKVAAGASVLYATGEESAAQVGARAARLGLAPGGLRIAPEAELPRILAGARELRAGVLGIASLPTVLVAGLEAGAGGGA